MVVRPASLKNLKPKAKIAPEGTAPLAVSVKIPASQYQPWMAIDSKERNEHLRKAIAQLIEQKKQQH